MVKANCFNGSINFVRSSKAAVCNLRLRNCCHLTAWKFFCLTLQLKCKSCLSHSNYQYKIINAKGRVVCSLPETEVPCSIFAKEKDFSASVNVVASIFLCLSFVLKPETTFLGQNLWISDEYFRAHLKWHLLSQLYQFHSLSLEIMGNYRVLTKSTSQLWGVNVSHGPKLK